MKTNRNISSTNWGLIARRIFNPEQIDDANDATQADLFTDEEQLELEQSKLLVKDIDAWYAQKKYDSEKAWRSVQVQAGMKRERKVFFPHLLRVAAVVVLLVLTGALSYVFLWHKQQPLTELAAASTPVQSFMLPDGTVISLNSGSKLFFPASFSGDKREVTLEGEGYFEVKPDLTKPFIIHAGKAQVKVLGTSFNVNAYPGFDKVEVIVDSGKVRVSPNDENTSETEELILVPGERGILFNSDNRLAKSQNEDLNFLAWKTRSLTFRETPLKEVAESLGKAYQTTITLENGQMDTLCLTGHYNDYSLEEILAIISSALPVEFEKQETTYMLKMRIP